MLFELAKLIQVYIADDAMIFLGILDKKSASAREDLTGNTISKFQSRAFEWNFLNPFIF